MTTTLGKPVQSIQKTQPMKPSDQEIATREACGHYPYRDWCRACVGGARRSDAHKRQREVQNCLPVGSVEYGFFADGQETNTSEITKGATPFPVLNSQAEHDDLERSCAMQRRGGPGSSRRNCRVVEQTVIPGVDCQIRQ